VDHFNLLTKRLGKVVVRVCVTANLQFCKNYTVMGCQ